MKGLVGWDGVGMEGRRIGRRGRDRGLLGGGWRGKGLVGGDGGVMEG